MTDDIKLLLGIKIGTEIYHVGDIVRVKDKSGGIVFEGKIEFKKYLDGEGCYDDYHLGFVVSGNLYRGYRGYHATEETFTLLDLLSMARRNKWEVENARN